MVNRRKPYQDGMAHADHRTHSEEGKGEDCAGLSQRGSQNSSGHRSPCNAWWIPLDGEHGWSSLLSAGNTLRCVRRDGGLREPHSSILLGPHLVLQLLIDPQGAPSRGLTSVLLIRKSTYPQCSRPWELGEERGSAE